MLLLFGSKLRERSNQKINDGRKNNKEVYNL